MKRLVLALMVLMSMIGIVYAANDSASHQVTMNVVECVVIDLNDTSTITLQTTAPAVGGDPVTGATDSTKRLQYTSLVPAGQTRRVTANWGPADSAPAGTSLRVEITAINGVAGNCGTATGQITLSNVAQNIITGIGSCRTGTGANGATVTYTFSIDDISQLQVGDSKTVTVTFTLTDAS